MNLEERLVFHMQAESHKYTANADDWEVFFTLNCNCKNQGLAIENHIKQMKSKVYITNLKKYPEMTEKLLLLYLNEC